LNDRVYYFLYLSIIQNSKIIKAIFVMTAGEILSLFYAILALITLILQDYKYQAFYSMRFKNKGIIYQFYPAIH
jgi:hypothetical protein